MLFIVVILFMSSDIIKYGVIHISVSFIEVHVPFLFMSRMYIISLIGIVSSSICGESPDLALFFMSFVCSLF